MWICICSNSVNSNITTWLHVKHNVKQNLNVLKKLSNILSVCRCCCFYCCCSKPFLSTKQDVKLKLNVFRLLFELIKMNFCRLNWITSKLVTNGSGEPVLTRARVGPVPWSLDTQGAGLTGRAQAACTERADSRNFIDNLTCWKQLGQRWKRLRRHWKGNTIDKTVQYRYQ